ncbi:MAG: hypothetical protein DCF19_21020 [Pseudanabaena frigida]|uniref:Uncharacterized protein n=1 Tax=Pseudanabaena frigida TaxID=945775 RepID=A0A2W4W3N0_9CYAN|nr:MAG: hypothetical protein DCF19_21020 [Pseudanabaena frigida]
MSREVIQDFLNLAGVVGIALTNRRMRPYFYGLDAVLDRTKQALGQGVLQVVENVPEGFESFEFHFAGHVVFIYKLTHGLVLLVLTDSGIEPVDYRRGITKIKYLIETDTYNTVAHFKLLLGSVTQHSLPRPNWNASATPITETAKVQDKPTTHSFANAITDPNPEINLPPSPSSASGQKNPNRNSQPNRIPSTNANTTAQIQPNITKPQTPPAFVSTSPSPINAKNNLIEVTDSHTKQVSVKTDTQEYKLDELLAALNKLSKFTTQYLGKVVVTNYWKSSCPESSWLKEFEVDRNGQISHPKQAAIICTLEQQQQIQSWVASYVKRCKQVIRNFDQMLEQDCLDERQKKFLM